MYTGNTRKTPDTENHEFWTHFGPRRQRATRFGTHFGDFGSATHFFASPICHFLQFGALGSTGADLVICVPKTE